MTLHRNIEKSVVAGVAAGLAEAAGLDTWFVRLLFILLFFTWGLGFVFYLYAWAIMPPTTDQGNLQFR